MRGVEISQGDSLDLKYSVNGVASLVGWKCRVVVKVNPEDATAIFDINLTTLSTEQDAFIGTVTRGTTQAWAPGEYVLVADVWNETTGKSVEIPGALRVKQQAVPNA